jgi:hypothetical protein
MTRISYFNRLIRSSCILLFTILFILACAKTPSEDEKAVSAVVTQFFHALASKDSTAALAVMMPQGRYYSIREDGSYRTQTHAEFFQRLAQETSDFLERMWDPTILIDDRIAVLWTPYDFHRDGQFSHCGVDAFSLIKTSKGWKIAGTIYSIKRQGCQESPLGPPE